MNDLPKEPDWMQEDIPEHTDEDYERATAEADIFIDPVAIKEAAESVTTKQIMKVVISSEVREQWIDFIETFTGVPFSSGRGSLSSSTLELAMRLFMAAVAKHKVQDVASDLIKVVRTNHKNHEELSASIEELFLKVW